MLDYHVTAEIYEGAGAAVEAAGVAMGADPCPAIAASCSFSRAISAFAASNPIFMNDASNAPMSARSRSASRCASYREKSTSEFGHITSLQCSLHFNLHSSLHSRLHLAI
jgi:hypothetical protein